MKRLFGKKEEKGAGGRPKLSVQQLQEQNDSLLDALSKATQDLANSRMAKHEVEQSNEQLVTKNSLLEKHVKSLETQVKKISQSFAFEQAQKTDEKIKQLETSLDVETKKSSDLQNELKTTNARIVKAEEDLEAANAAKIKLLKMMGEGQTTLEKKEKKIEELRSNVKALKEEMNELDATVQAERKALEDSTTKKISETKSACDAQVQGVQGSIHKLEGERNNYMHKCKTLQKELGKVLMKLKNNDLKQIKAENERLKEELDRRTKSLENALSALDTFAVGNLGSRGTTALDQATGNHQFFALQREVQKLKADLRKSEVQVQEKDLIIAQLKNATHFFGAKIIELEDRDRKSQMSASHSEPEMPTISITSPSRSRSSITDNPIDRIPMTPPTSNRKSKETGSEGGSVSSLAVPRGSDTKPAKPGDLSICSDADLP